MKCWTSLLCGFDAVEQTIKIPMVITTHANVEIARQTVIDLGTDQRKRLLK
jgi:hypothetical protein